MEKITKLIINTDGGARGNPGPAGIGAVIADDRGKIISRHKKYIGEATNNAAEYRALILALDEAEQVASSKYQVASRQVNLEIRMDSELIVRQMQGRYKIKDSGLKILAAKVLKLMEHFRQVAYKHVPREQNQLADELVNQAIDSAIGF